MIYGLSYLGVVHTRISLVAVVAALIAFVRDKGPPVARRAVAAE